MSSHVAWGDIRAAHVERAGGEAAVDAASVRCLPRSSATVSPRSAVPAA